MEGQSDLPVLSVLVFKQVEDGVKMKEIWREIPNYNGDYFISNHGRVKSYKKSKPLIMRPSYSDQLHQYQTVQLFKNGAYKTHKVHRLVAESFIPKIPGKDYVNHIDGNPKNNTVENLEWCTLSENSWHSWNILGREYGGYKRKIVCKETGVIYPSLHECARCLSASPSTIHKALNLRSKTGEKYKCRGFHFEYID